MSLSNLVYLINRAVAVHGIWVNPLKSSLQLSFVVDVPVIIALHLKVVELFTSIRHALYTGNFEVVNGW